MRSPLWLGGYRQCPSAHTEVPEVPGVSHRVVCLQLAGGHGLKEGAVSKQPAGSDSILWLLEWKTVA